MECNGCCYCCHSALSSSPLLTLPDSFTNPEDVTMIFCTPNGFHVSSWFVLPGHLDLEGLFLVNGNAERVGWLRRRYDSGEEVALDKEADLASAVSLLRLFLQELPEPVIPAPIQGPILQLHQGGPIDRFRANLLKATGTVHSRNKENPHKRVRSTLRCCVGKGSRVRF